MISLVKLGNLKLGLVKNGKPIQTQRILVTRATKEGGENFQILDGFNLDGEEKVEISLPFDDNHLNFEVNYVGFVKVNDVEYISKAKAIGDDLILYPLNVEDFDLPAIKVGPLTEELIGTYNLERTGFLKCMLNKISGFGEVFYFKTKSVHSIRAIEDQLEILKHLTKGKIAGIPLVLKPVKKDIDEKQVLYVSLSFEGKLNELSEAIKERSNSYIDFEAFEKAYVESRIPNIRDFDAGIEIKVERDTEQEIAEIQNQAEENKKEETAEEVLMKKLLKDNDIELTVPEQTLYAVFSALKFDEAVFVDFIKTDLTIQSCLLKLKELKRS